MSTKTNSTPNIKNTSTSATGNGPARKRPTQEAINAVGGAVGGAVGDALHSIRFGQSVSVGFFTKNAWILVVVLVTVLSLIGLRYKTKTKMEQIKRLNHQLELAESEKLQEKAAYMSLIRETEMLRLIQNKSLGLEFQEQPPYEVQSVKE